MNFQKKDVTIMIENEKLKDNSDIVFLTIKDVIKITGYSKKTVELLFNDPDFPSCDFGKKKIVEKMLFFNIFQNDTKKTEVNTGVMSPNAH